MITLFTNYTNECILLEAELIKRGIKYVKNDNIELMKERAILALPKLEVSGKLLNFKEAMRWVECAK